MYCSITKRCSYNQAMLLLFKTAVALYYHWVVLAITFSCSSHCWRLVIKQKTWVVSWSLGIGGTLVHFVYGSWSCTLLHWSDNMLALSFLVLLSSSEGFFLLKSTVKFLVHGPWPRWWSSSLFSKDCIYLLFIRCPSSPLASAFPLSPRPSSSSASREHKHRHSHPRSPYANHVEGVGAGFIPAFSACWVKWGYCEK
ncbi:predicted protein [Lichtheimia corymbifera JMRC:FSU:9682]|uniref:Uncharacterized protein n=1 Tax=Lichtheimia corymbifera JMRC:FSU:9682 TaxID=1263082 RepID=A0A068RV77_9FUNG|nr:predicted protein [Lichtheimia corymbifera JMRC:FSU:9682]